MYRWYLLRSGARRYACQALYSTSSKRRWLLSTLTTAGVAVIAAVTLRDDQELVRAGQVEPQLPTYSMQQVQQHSKGSRAWVVYRHGVYDVTEFAGVHPGGDRILQAAGKSVELFWHQSEPHSRAGAPETLEELRVGNLSEEDFDRLEELKKTPSTSGEGSAVEEFFLIEGTSTSSAPEEDFI